MNPGAVVAVGANGGPEEKPAKVQQMQTPALFTQVMAMRPAWDEMLKRYSILAVWQRLSLWAVLALLVVIIAAYGYFTHNATKPSTTAFIVPSQSVKW